MLDQREAGGEGDGREGVVVGEGRSSDADEAVGKADVVQVVAPGVECVGIEEERQTCHMERTRLIVWHARAPEEGAPLDALHTGGKADVPESRSTRTNVPLSDLLEAGGKDVRT